MLKIDEQEIQNSCWNKASIGERLFILLARDPASPVAIRAWIEERIRIGKNRKGDALIKEAEDCARRMEQERDDVRRALGK